MRDWHDNKHFCPPGHLRDMAIRLAEGSIGDRRIGVASFVARAKALERWLAPHFASPDSAVWNAAVDALDAAARNSKRGPSLRPLPVAAVLAWAEAYLAFKGGASK